MKIGLACDHAGFLHKEKTKEYLENLGYSVNDYGCFSEKVLIIQILHIN